MKDLGDADVCVGETWRLAERGGGRQQVLGDLLSFQSTLVFVEDLADAEHSSSTRFTWTRPTSEEQTPQGHEREGSDTTQPQSYCLREPRAPCTAGSKGGASEGRMGGRKRKDRRTGKAGRKEQVRRRLCSLHSVLEHGQLHRIATKKTLSIN